MKKIVLVLSVLILASLACAMPRINLPGKSNVIFSDDFNNPDSSSWDTITSDFSSIAYEDDRIVMELTAGGMNLRTRTNRVNVADVSIEVDSYKLSATDENDQGVLCRVQDDMNFYSFAFGTDGYVNLIKRVNGEFTKLYGAFLDKSITSGAENHLRVDCIGSILTLYINGQKIVAVEDTSLSNSGDVGLFTGSYDPVPVRIAYDNFVVRNPD